MRGMIGKMKQSRIDAVMDIWLKTNKEAHPFIDGTFWEGKYETVRSLLPQAEMLVFEERDVIKGFMGITGGTFIAGLFVLKECQKKGIGKKLLDEGKRTCERLELNVYVKNVEAVGFYKKNGFRIAEERTDEETFEQEYVMRWEKSDHEKR